MASDHRKPVPQGPGWACFYCDEVFLTQTGAEDHFGFFGESVDNSDPACVQALTYGEKALRAAMMDMYRELEAERDANHELEAELEQLQGIRPDLERSFDGARTVHEAWLKLDFERGRALASEAIVNELEKVDPAGVATARAIVCGDAPPAIDPCSALCRECKADGICMKNNPAYARQACPSI